MQVGRESGELERSSIMFQETEYFYRISVFSSQPRGCVEVHFDFEEAKRGDLYIPCTLRYDEMFDIMMMKLQEHFANSVVMSVNGTFSLEYYTHDGHGGRFWEIKMNERNANIPLRKRMGEFFHDILRCFVLMEPIYGSRRCEMY